MMISRADLPSDQTMLVLGVAVALALLAAFTAIVNAGVDAAQRRWLAAEVASREPSGRTAPADRVRLQAAATERRSGPTR